MISNFLRIRLIQLKREAYTLGFFYSLFLLGVIAFACLILHKHMNMFPNAIYATGLIAILVLSIHISRKDKKFVAITGESARKIFFIEYSFFSIPLFVIVLLSRHWYLAFLLLSFEAGITWINFELKKKTGFIPFRRLIPANNFEWIAGIRKYIWYILPLYALAIGLLFIKLVSLFILWLIIGVIASFYQECEPSNIIHAEELPAKRFITQKLKVHLKTYLLFSFPIILGYLIFQTETAWVALLIYFMSAVNLCYFILSKYSFYEPNRTLRGNSVTLGFVMISVFIPFFLPLPIVMCIREYSKSKTNLEYYLNAYN